MNGNEPVNGKRRRGRKDMTLSEYLKGISFETPIPREELEQLLSFLKDTGLPLTLAQLGVKEIVPDGLCVT